MVPPIDRLSTVLKPTPLSHHNRHAATDAGASSPSCRHNKFKPIISQIMRRKLFPWRIGKCCRRCCYIPSAEHNTEQPVASPSSPKTTSNGGKGLWCGAKNLSAKKRNWRWGIISYTGVKAGRPLLQIDRSRTLG